MLLFGQRHDSLVRAFTDTYFQGFSQLNDQCVGVECGGHYLCTVAARGHARVVHPLRLGRRGGGVIVCNRQLLVANAFEQVLEQRWPRSHRWVRRRYDRIGDTVFRTYRALDSPFACDAVYLLMKPAEWGFLLVLYAVDPDPEGRIARQYV